MPDATEGVVAAIAATGGNDEVVFAARDRIAKDDLGGDDRRKRPRIPDGFATHRLVRHSTCHRNNHLRPDFRDDPAELANDWIDLVHRTDSALEKSTHGV